MKMKHNLMLSLLLFAILFNSTVVVNAKGKWVKIGEKSVEDADGPVSTSFSVQAGGDVVIKFYDDYDESYGEDLLLEIIDWNNEVVYSQQFDCLFDETEYKVALPVGDYIARVSTDSDRSIDIYMYIYQYRDVPVFKLNKKELNLNIGKSYNLKLSCDIDDYDYKVTWSSKNSKIASVNSDGKVTGKKVGTTTIYAKVNGEKYECTVTVNKKMPKFSEMAKKLKSYESKKKSLEYKVIKKGQKSQLITTSFLYEFNYESSIYMGGGFAPYIQIEKNGSTTDVKLYWSSVFALASFYPEYIEFDTITFKSGDQKVSFNIKKYSEKTEYLNQYGAYQVTYKSNLLISKQDAANIDKVNKLIKIFNSPKFSVKYENEEGSYITQTHKTKDKVGAKWVRMLKIYKELLGY